MKVRMKDFRTRLIVLAILPVILPVLVIKSCCSKAASVKIEPQVESELYVRLGTGQLVKFSDLHPGYLSETPSPPAVEEQSTVVKEKKHRHHKAKTATVIAKHLHSTKAKAKTALVRHTKAKKAKATAVATNHSHRKQQAKAKRRKIKDMDEGSTYLASVGTPIVFSQEPTARELVYKRYVHWQKSLGTLKTMERIEQYQGYIDQYSAQLGLDPELPWGLIAVESRGKARAVSPSPIYAKGLGQIYRVPSLCHRRAEEIAGVDRINVWDPRQNIILSLVTLHYYTSIKNNNLLLGLVSYNCGPGHRKLKGVHSYEDLRIKKGIKRYPIDVLALTLVAKVRKQYGEILPYNEENRAKIEGIYLPGLGM